MTSKTSIPELVVGSIALYMVGWLWWAIVGIQLFVLSGEYRATVDVSSTGYVSLTLSAAACVLALGAFFLIGVYCYGICIERLIFWGIEKYRKRKNNLFPKEPGKEPTGPS